MKRVVEVLENPSAILDRFFALTGEVRMLPDMEDERALVDFLQSHERYLVKIGVTEPAIQKLTALLKDNFSETLRASVMVHDGNGDGNAGRILAELRDLQRWICTSAAAVDRLKMHWSPKMLKACALGAVGAATVVVDVTSVFVPSLTLPLFFHAVASTLAGRRMVKSAIGAIREAFDTLSTKETQAKLKNTKPESPFPVK
jgi:hypothetical protein